MTAPAVIVTRAFPGAAETASRLIEEGYAPLVSPALELAGLPLPDFDDASFPQLIFTSANGVRFFCDASASRDKIAWCVGPSTARAARQAGFTDIREGQGNGQQLAQFILSDPASANAPLLHVANDAAAGQLVKMLKAEGREAEFAALYTTHSSSDLTQAAKAALAGPDPLLLLIHSAKGATAFTQLLAGAGLENCTIVAISAAAAAPLAGKGARAIIIAAAPTEDALFQALDAARLSL